MTDVYSAPMAARVATGILLVAGGAAATATAVLDTSDRLTGAALGIVTASLVATLLSLEPVAARRVLRAVVAGLALGAAGYLLHPLGDDTAVLAATGAGALVLLWAAIAWGRYAPVQLLVPATAAIGVTWVNGDPSVSVAALAAVPVAAALAELLARPLERARGSRALVDAAVADVDALLVAALDLRGVDDVAAAGDRICRLATELLDGDGALLYVQGPGRMLLGGRHGSHPGPLDPELGRDAAIEDVLRLGAVRPGEPVLVPVTGGAGVIGVIAVSGARREIDGLTAGFAQLFGGQVGAVLDRLNAIESLYDAATRDPVTGVGNRQQATALIASLRPGDALLVLEVDAFESLRRAQGDAAADLLLGQVGLHLRNGTRNGDAVARYGDHQFVVALRDLKCPIDMIVRRLVDSWLAASPSRTMSVGGALHLDAGAPIDTVERAESALASAQRRGGGAGHVAADFAAFAAN